MTELLKRLAARILKTPVDPPDPPAGSHASVQVFRASPRYLSYKLLPFWIGALIGLGFEASIIVGTVVGVGTGEMPLAGAILIDAALVIAYVVGVFFGYFAIRLDYELRYYILTDRSLRIREGAWTVKEITLTHANIQNLRVTQGPLQRLFGISDIQVDTAGGGGIATAGAEGGSMGGHHARLAGIENAAEVRDQIRGYLKARAARGSGLGDPDEDEGPGGAPGFTKAVLEALRGVHAAAAELRHAAVERGGGGRGSGGGGGRGGGAGGWLGDAVGPVNGNKDS